MQPTTSRNRKLASRIKHCLLADIVIPSGLPDFSNDIVISSPEKRLSEEIAENLKPSSVKKAQEPEALVNTKERTDQNQTYILDAEDSTIPQKKVFCEKKLKNQKVPFKESALLLRKNSFCENDLCAHSFYEAASKQHPEEEEKIPPSKVHIRLLSKSAASPIPLESINNNTKKCTFGQGQALKYLRILGKKLRAHYYLHNSPLSKISPESACMDAFSWSELELISPVSRNNSGNVSMSPIRHRRELSPILEPEEKSFIRAFQQFQKLEFASPNERKQSDQYAKTSILEDLLEEEQCRNRSGSLSKNDSKRGKVYTSKSSIQAVKDRLKKSEGLAAFQVQPSDSHKASITVKEEKSKISDHPVILSLASYLGSQERKTGAHHEERGRDLYRARGGFEKAKKEFSTASHSPASLERRREIGRAAGAEICSSETQNSEAQKETLQQVVGDEKSMKDLFKNIGNLFKSLEHKKIERSNTTSPVREAPHQRKFYEQCELSAAEEEPEESESAGGGSGCGFHITLYQMRGGSASRSPQEFINSDRS